MPPITNRPKSNDIVGVSSTLPKSPDCKTASSVIPKSEPSTNKDDPVAIAEIEILLVFVSVVIAIPLPSNKIKTELLELAVKFD
jgi:hypothetical protein